MTSKLKLTEVALLLLFALFFLYVGWCLGFNRLLNLPNPSNNSDVNKLNSIYSVITNSYYTDDDSKVLADKVFSAMVQGLEDKNSFYVNSSQYEKIKTKTSDPNITSEKISDKISYLRFDWFTEDLETKISPTLKTIDNSPDQTLVLDLRNNLGGNTESMLWFLNRFISNSDLIIEKYNNKKIVDRVATPATLDKVKVFVIVSKETSSSAEITTALLKEKRNAIVLGEPTYGKSDIGNFFEFKDGSAIHLTIGKWVTASGLDIGGKGVTVDIPIENVNDKDYKNILTVIETSIF